MSRNRNRQISDKFVHPPLCETEMLPVQSLLEELSGLSQSTMIERCIYYPAGHYFCPLFLASFQILTLCCLHTFRLKMKIYRRMKSKIITGPCKWYGLYKIYWPVHFLLVDARVTPSGVCWICWVCSVLYHALVCMKIAFKAALPDQTVSKGRQE